jgi:hypothetical protein
MAYADIRAGRRGRTGALQSIAIVVGASITEAEQISQW